MLVTAKPDSKTAVIDQADLELAGLTEAFGLFTETASRLEEAHLLLQNRVAEVDRELERKNRQLEEANWSLQANIEELDETHRYLDSVLASIEDGLISLDLSGRVMTINPAACRILGTSDDLAAGSSSGRILGEEPSACVADCLKTGSGYRRIEFNLRRPGKHPVPARAAITPILDRTGEQIGVLITFRDLSQIRLLEEKVRRSDRLAALGELAAGVAHEMRNPLTTIRGYFQILPRMSGEDDFMQRMSTSVVDEIDRLAKLTEGLLDLAKPVGQTRTTERAAGIIREVVAFHNAGDGHEGVGVEEGEVDESLHVKADPGRLKQVMLNIFLNALQAAGEDGRVRYGVGMDEGQVETDSEPVPLARFWIRDSGPGIDPENLPRIFDPFFTTKDSGTGLGLTLSHRIVEEHGGVIRVDSEPGGGTEFSVYLPLVSAEETR